MIVLNFLAAAVVVLRGLYVLNHMSKETSMPIRASWLVLTGGAAAVLLASAVPTWPEVALHLGVAALVVIDRRNPLFREVSK